MGQAHRRSPATKIVALPQKTANEQRITNNEQLSLLCDSAREILLVACLFVYSRRQAAMPPYVNSLNLYYNPSNSCLMFSFLYNNRYFGSELF